MSNPLKTAFVAGRRNGLPTQLIPAPVADEPDDDADEELVDAPAEEAAA